MGRFLDPHCASTPVPDTHAMVIGESPLLFTLRLGTAAVWLLFGLVFKVFQVLPRHETIVAEVLGPVWAGPLTIVIGGCETLLGLWILSRRWPVPCIAVQTAAICTMNTFELLRARDHLLSPVGMVVANGVFLSLGWFLALRTAKMQESH
jgi:hypothetical protein